VGQHPRPLKPVVAGVPPTPAVGRSFSQFRIGDRFGTTVSITEEHLDNGARLIGDFNPLHVDADFARSSRFGGRILHGVLTSALMSAPFGNLVSGTALGYLEHNTRFTAPVRPGDTLVIEWTVTDLIEKAHHGGGIVVADCTATNQTGELVATAHGKMLVADSPLPG
jgi:3-hydroxybutyryl-CoA dehydratase